MKANLIGVPRESAPRERRVAIVPQAIEAFRKLGLEVVVERSAGTSAGFADEEYAAAGASLGSRDEVFDRAEVICMVRGPGAGATAEDLELLRRGQSPEGAAGAGSSRTLVATLDPLGSPEAMASLAATGVTAFALELLPRTTRAQAMDVLSSQATAAGYAAVLLAASNLPRFLPMFMTAAGTIPASRVLVIGAGVAGLQAIATARRLGAIVSAYDVRRAVREQIESLGARFVELFPDEVAQAAGGAEGSGGYAKAMDEAFYERQRAALAKVCAEQDIVITTAAIPGRRSPLLITRAAVEAMKPGSVIVDLAAERGGNCELARADEMVEERGVRIFGPTDLPSRVAADSSRMYARNLLAFLTPMRPKAKAKAQTQAGPQSGTASGSADAAPVEAASPAPTLAIDLTDEIQRETLVCRGGAIVHERIRPVSSTPS